MPPFSMSVIYIPKREVIRLLKNPNNQSYIVKARYFKIDKKYSNPCCNNKHQRVNIVCEKILSLFSCSIRFVSIV